ncbi:alkaline ceramidase [Fusobacterium sp.]|uniref:alkaline ceramidase n=1 Tax=Fusobacterium sp. TaxID=68766 RepID=UPI0028FF5330|nr:alkaline ceramidase [Fusobacterium sp.]MDU1912024.1 alkaline ceramidase [Fusobacterium sp.]
MKMGYGERDITPDYSIEMVGFYRADNLSKGILDKLYVQCALFDFNNEYSCIIAIDSIGFTTEDSDYLRNIIGKNLKINKDRVMLCFSHTHSAPNNGIERSYFDFICLKTLQAVNEALNNMIPVKASWGNFEGNIGENRRNNSALDKRIGILKISTFDSDNIKLILLRVTAHANILNSDNYFISSDYFGSVRKFLKEKYDCDVILTQGASGNIRPLYRQKNTDFLETHSYEYSLTQANKNIPSLEAKELINKTVQEIYTGIDKIIYSLIPQKINRLSMFSEIKRFYSDVPSIERAEEILIEAKEKAGIDGSAWLKEIKKLNNEKINKQYTDIEIQYFILNNGCICGVPEEIMCEMALGVVEKTNNNQIYLGGYTNGCSGYFPTCEEFLKGGYEVVWSYLIYYIYHGRVSSLTKESGSILVNTIVSQLKNLHIKKSLN